MLILVLIFAIYVYKSFKERQRVNIEITLQKQIIEEKQNEIVDSIHYAKRIQTALITSEKYIDKNLNRLNQQF
jgi:Ca2+/Na+ antiporter